MDSGEIDYFSYLPEVLLFTIISFLPFKDAVRTSALSHRWHHVWHAAKHIDFDEKFFVKDEDSSDEETKATQRSSFVTLITQWMEKCVETDLHTFRLVFSDSKPYLPQIQECIRFCINRDVKELDLNFADPTWDEEDLERNPETFLELSSDRDSLTRLESLKLSACNFRVSQTLDRFCSLKSVHLGWIEFPDCSIENLISMCPFLETLILKRCWNMESIYLGHADRLRVFVLDKCLGFEVIFMDAPNLSFFEYSGPSVNLQIEYYRRLTEVVLDFGLQYEYLEDGEGEMFYNFLANISSVSVLTICSYMLQQIVTAEDPITLKPPLANVRHLILKTELHMNEFYGISFFLQNCPNMEMLTIDLFPRRIFRDYQPPYLFEDHQFLASTPYFSYSSMRSLKVVEVKGFKGKLYEMYVLKYLLKCSTWLESLFITPSCDEIDMKATYIRKIQMLTQFETASDRLQIYLCKQ